MKPIVHIFIDLDGVLADWVAGVLDLFGTGALSKSDWPAGEYSIERVLGISTDRLWSVINRQGSEWWAHLEPLPQYAALLGLIWSTEVEASILTAPGVCDYEWTGKAQWVARHAQEYRHSLHMSQDKALLAGPGRLLIDDSDENCRRFIEAGGQAIVYPQPWNTAHLYAGRPLPTVKRQLVQLGVIPQAIREETA